MGLDMTQIRNFLVSELVDAGELVRRGDDFYEDMGGHILHESNLDGHITSYMNSLRKEDLRDLINRARGGE